MPKNPAGQLSLDALFDTTAISSSLTLDGGGSRLPPEEHDEPVALAPVRVPAKNWRLTGTRDLATGWKGRAGDNLAAIRLLRQLETEDRAATAAEQDRLARFTAFGATELSQTMFRRAGEPFRAGWEDLGSELEQLVDQSEMAGLARATQYAHYTPEFMVRSIWDALTRMGFSGGNVLEPGCGTGLFLALMPEKAAAKAAMTGIEADPITARIAAKLFPEAWIRAEDFTKARLTERYDVVVGNPPFSDRTVRADDPAGKLGLSLHDYFIARSIERLKPGGVAAFVTSRWTMDKTVATAREHIAGLADLIGAVRMPQGAMKADAGTEVVVDVLVFQRHHPETSGHPVEWADVVEVAPDTDGEGTLSANRYFRNHPEMVLGDHAWTSSQYGPVYTCRAREGVDVEAALGRALAVLSEGVRLPAPDLSKSDRPKAARIVVGTAAEGATVKEGSYVLIGDALHQVLDGEPRPVSVKSSTVKEGIFAKHARILRGLIPVRDAVRAVLRAQEANEPWGTLQTRLRVAYNSFVRQFGPINHTTVSHRTDEATGEVTDTVRRPNLQPFLDDPDCWLVASIEEYDVESDTAKPGPVFSQRVIHPPVEPVITSAADALAVTLHEVGHVDLARVAELIGRSREETLAELGEAVFLNPSLTTEGFEVWETADAYLSGPVRTKLAAAEAAAALQPGYARNAAALRLVQPEDLRPSDITARLGAPWIPAEVVARFSAEVIGIETLVRHTVEVAAWSIDLQAFAGQAAATSEWGTQRRHAGELLHDALNAVIPQIYDTWKDADGEHRVLNAADTEAAKEKLAKIKTSFERWIWTDVERTERLARIYNDRFNNLVPRTFDGRHLRLPGASSVISLREHQKRVIWRIISAGGTYIAHAVGAGKTFSMAAAIMEQRRLGLITKAMMTVPGHCLAQASREFLQLYPNAKILVADETNFVKEKRQRFLARAATGVWDCIIITHSAFKFIPAPAAFEEGLIQEQLQSYADLLEKADSDDRITRKRIERMKEGLEAKLEALGSVKDDMLTISEIGVDQIVVDEAQEFRKLSFPTNMSNLRGVAPDGSQRAWDLYVKSRFVALCQPQRPLILASGTPITNTLGEMFTLQRFMQPDVLEERGLHEFDAWASSFGDTRTELELQPSGNYKPITRFAEFVNVPELIAMFRSVADVVLKDDLRQFMRLPDIRGGKRQIVTAPASPAFKAYQKVLAKRIKLIEERKGKPNKGDDILLSVITDGRHAAIDMRFVVPSFEDDPREGNDPHNKLNAMIGNIHRIWLESADRTYHRPDGTLHPLRGGAQMVFSDLGTEAADGKRGFSAYLWVRDELIRLGVPREQIAFMQDYKKSAAKQGLFNDVNAGKVRILLGSTQTMGTGVNAQQRLVALHHLDVPWLPSDIEQREGRIERQGNQNEEIELYAYATLGSVDATSWQLLERKARFIAAALAGDRTIRRLEDVDGQANQFAMAKALASGDQRLMQKAGIEAEVARLRRLHAAHFDDQHAIAQNVRNAEAAIRSASTRIAQIEEDLRVRISTRGDAFAMVVGKKPHTERKVAGGSLLSKLRLTEKAQEEGTWTMGQIGGFDLRAQGKTYGKSHYRMNLWLERTGYEQEVELSDDLTALGLISRLEYMLDRFEADLAEHRRRLAEAEQRLPGYRQRVGEVFGFQAEMEAKEAELAALEADLAANDNRDADQPDAEAAA
ncbi:MAG: methyltransferase [Gluconacetobacter diazotrophicus]|nr:methyltransferase [Gluconacetobacter diazotrophicus]